MKKTLVRSVWAAVLCFSCIFLNADVKTWAAENGQENIYGLKVLLEEAAVNLKDFCDWRYVRIYFGEEFFIMIDLIFILILLILLFIMVMRRLLYLN